jgi:hypothetical protein
MHKAVFTIGDYPKAYIGYTSGRTWNGWATPYFELEEAKRVAVGFDECAENPIFYNKESKKFYTFGTDYISAEIWEEETIQTEDGIKHLYGIGAYSWIWDEANDDDCLYLAQGIEDFIYEYDTYGYRDVGIDRYEMVEAITNQLKEPTVFKQAYEIWHDEELTEDERFDKLSKLLTV